MTSQRQRICELMLEFHALCGKQGAAYYLIGPQLLHAARDGVMHGYELDVAMFLKDWNKVARWAGNSDWIEIESVLDHGDLPGCFYRFVNKNTLLLDLDRYGKLAKPGVGIHVHIIRNKRKKETLLRLLEKGMNDLCARRFSFAALVTAPVRALMGRERFARFADGLLKIVGAVKNDSQSVTELYEPGKHRTVFPGGFWAERCLVKLGGMRLYTAAGYQKYLIQRYGKRWVKCETDAVKKTYRCVFNPSLPYARYMEVIKREGLVTDQFLRRVRRYAVRYEKFRAMKAHEDEGWEKTMFFPGERFRLWKKYMPLKERIMSLYKQGALDEVELMLFDYLTVFEQYMKMNMVMCFDSDLLEVVKSLYSTYGKTGLVDKIDKFVLPADLEPIVPTWQK